MNLITARLTQLQNLVTTIFGEALHHKRQLSLAYAALSLLWSRQLRLHEMGASMARVRGVDKKHATKQIDRLLSNKGYDIWELAKYWVPHVIGTQPSIVVALDWTSYHADKQHMICLNILGKQGRSTPLLWKTVPASRLKHNRARYEDQLLSHLKTVLPAKTDVTVVADRGFASQAFFQFLTDELKFNYIIRLRTNVRVENEKGETRRLQAWQRQDGRAHCLKNAYITKARHHVNKLAIVKDKGMKQAWFLASNLEALTTRALINLYAKRWKIETYFRDIKDSRFGYGLKQTHIKRAERRDRLFLLIAMAYLLLTVLGEAGEQLGLDTLLKVNTVKTRTHSLFRQGQYYLDYFIHLSAEKQQALVEKFGQLIENQRIWLDLL